MGTNREYWTKRLEEALNLESWAKIFREYEAWLKTKCDDRKMIEEYVKSDCENCQECYTKWLNEEVSNDKT